MKFWRPGGVAESEAAVNSCKLASESLQERLRFGEVQAAVSPRKFLTSLRSRSVDKTVFSHRRRRRSISAGEIGWAEGTRETEIHAR
jgi:hypothetical protein